MAGFHMPFVSVTRLRVRSLRFLPLFAITTMRTRRQLLDADGFVQGRLTIEWPLAFWTMTVWNTVDAMRRYRNHPPHKGAMVRLLDWCDEASYVHWEQATTDVPSVDVAYGRLQAEGKTSKVRHPTSAHADGATVSAKRPQSTPPFGPG
jgi:hypothetical protein